MNSDEKLQETHQKKESFDLNCKDNELLLASASSSNDDKHDRKSKTCTYYFKFGHCKFDSNCKYLHGKEAGRIKCNGSFQHTETAKDCYSRPLLNNKSYNSNLMQGFNRKLSSKQSCKYFKAGFCEKGDDCNFRHTFSEFEDEEYLSTSTFSERRNKNTLVSSNRTLKKKSVPLCYYFKRGQCYKGDHCKFYHQNKNTHNESSVCSSTNCVKNKKDSALSSNIPSEMKIYKTDKPEITTNKTQNINNLSTLTTEDIAKLRATEINQMKKRFPHYEIVIENGIFSVLLQPSDPDWPFDLRNLKVEISFPENYPVEKPIITVLQNAENIPELLVKHLNKSISEWIDHKYEQNAKNDKVELIFRPFLKWFDKNLEELFITGLRKVKQDLKAKEDGIEFVPAENLFSLSERNDEDNNPNFKENLEFNVQLQLQNSSEKLLNLDDVGTKSFENSNNNGFKIIFSELELTEGAAALICTKISATLHCSRCKNSFNMKSVPKKSNSHICSKCSKDVGFVFDPSTAHQFSNVLGNLYLLNCLAVDINLVECHFLVDCLNCSKQVSVDGIQYGQKHKMWCIFCHEKMTLSIGSVKFQTLRLDSVPAVKYVPAKKIEKKIKDPVVKEGEPLPNYGACKHYKKSYRWLRFPCCGRLYPCDECHNDKETDHEMKYASRMICGFCAKEQPYSREKPCLVCSQTLTKKAGSHWEGGKGCRNKIQMNREDKQKYSGISKTISKKAQSAKLKKK